MLRRCIILIAWFGLLAFAGVETPFGMALSHGNPLAQEAPTDKAKKPDQAKQSGQEKGRSQERQVTGDQVAETALLMSGTREGMAQVRKTGIERGRITRVVGDGKIEEVTYERRVIRGENMEKDKIRLDQKMPTAEYALIFSEGQVWGIINDAIFTPRKETTQDFLSRQLYGIDTLLRYKENGSTINLVGKEKQKGLDLWVVDVTDKEQRRIRFYVSAKTAKVLWLEYEVTSDSGGPPVKYLRNFHDYHIVQGTLVPYRTVLYKDGNQIEEIRIQTITFGPKIEEEIFKNSETPPQTTASKP